MSSLDAVSHDTGIPRNRMKQSVIIALGPIKIVIDKMVRFNAYIFNMSACQPNRPNTKGSRI